jgi:hypothetical protein
MNDTFDGLIGKTVARVELEITHKDGCDYKDVLTLHFTDGSRLTVCENDPDIYLNGLEVFASINEDVTN